MTVKIAQILWSKIDVAASYSKEFFHHPNHFAGFIRIGREHVFALAKFALDKDAFHMREALKTSFAVIGAHA